MRILSIVILVLILGACKRQPISTLPTENSTQVNNTKLNNTPVGKDFRSMKAECKVKFRDSLNDAGFHLQLRIVKDSAIWVRISKIGVEGFRAIITKDSVRILDKMKDIYYASKFDTLEKVLNFRLDFQMLQAVLLANMPIAEYDSSKVQLERSLMKIPQEKDGIAITNFLNKSTEKLHELFLLDKRTNNTLNLFYQDFKVIDGNPFAEKNTAIISFWNKNTRRMEKSEIEINYNNVKFLRGSVDLPFTIPRNYKRN